MAIKLPQGRFIIAYSMGIFILLHQRLTINVNNMKDRHFYEEIIRTEFIKKGGIIKRNSPHYMVIEHSPWLSTWFENCDYI